MKDYDTNSFLGSGYKQLDLKYIFDHVRNIGIAAALLVAGVNVDSNIIDQALPNLPFSHGWFAVAIAAVSFALVVLNFSQFLYIAVNKGTRASVSIVAALSVPLYFLTAVVYVAYVSSF